MNKVIWGAVVVIILGVLGFYLLNSSPDGSEGVAIPRPPSLPTE